MVEAIWYQEGTGLSFGVQVGNPHSGWWRDLSLQEIEACYTTPQLTTDNKTDMKITFKATSPLVHRPCLPLASPPRVTFQAPTGMWRSLPDQDEELVAPLHGQLNFTLETKDTSAYWVMVNSSACLAFPSFDLLSSPWWSLQNSFAGGHQPTGHLPSYLCYESVQEGERRHDLVVFSHLF